MNKEEDKKLRIINSLMTYAAHLRDYGETYDFLGNTLHELDDLREEVEKLKREVTELKTQVTLRQNENLEMRGAYEALRKIHHDLLITNKQLREELKEKHDK